MSESDIRSDYFNWLCHLIGAGDGQATYRILARVLHGIDYVSRVEHDENRALDGIDLRSDYAEEVRLSDKEYDYYFYNLPCSVLEMLIGLSQRIDYETSDPYEPFTGGSRTERWWLEIVGNLGLSEFDDEHWHERDGDRKVPVIIRQWIDRQYLSNGVGGIFPLDKTDVDQRQVDTWYQMCAYLNEKEVV